MHRKEYILFLGSTKRRITKEVRFLGLTMKQWRLVKGLTQDYMAARCEVHRNTYADWEDNPGKVPVGKALIIAETFGESINDVFFSADTLQNME